MATTECGVNAAPTTSVPRARPRPPAPPLRPLATATYEPLDIPGLGPEPRPRWTWLAYLVLLGAALGAATWAFASPDVGGPAGRPLVPAGVMGELWSTWSHQFSGGGSSSYPVARVVEAEALGAVTGVAPRTVEIVVAVLALLYAAGAVAYLARRFVRTLPAALAGAAAVANPYVLSALPDPRRLVVIGLGASLGGLAWAIADGHRPRPFALLLASLPVLVLSDSPMAVGGLAGWALLCAASAMFAGSWPAVGRLLLTALWAVPLLVLAHLWWLVPAASALGPGREGIELVPDRPAARATLLALAVPAAAVAGALVVDRLWLRSEHSIRVWRSRVLALLALGATAALPVLPFLAAPAPTPATLAPSSLSLAEAINSSPVAGKVVVLAAPSRQEVAMRAVSYQPSTVVTEVPLPPGLLRRHTAAGRRATAGSQLRDLVERPVVGGEAAGLFREPRGLAARVRRLQDDLGRGRVAAAGRDLDQLGASHLVVPVGDTVRLQGWRTAGSFGDVGLYERVRSAPLVRTQAAGRGIVPRARWVRHDPAHYSVRIEGADGTFTLALAESFGRGWRLDVPPDWSARHHLVAGYANGWRVDGHGSATVQLRYGSTARTQIAGAVSVATLATVVALTLLTGLYRRLQQAERGRGPAPEGTRPRGCGDAHLT